MNNPVKGGTAKIIAPWFHKNQYINGYFNNHEKGNGVDLQYEEPFEYDEIGERNGRTVYIRYTNQYTDEYYINDGVWANKIYASKWSKGALMVGKYSSLHYGQGISFEGSPGYTMNFSVKSAEGASFKTYMGVRYNYARSGSGMRLAIESNANSLVTSGSVFKTVQMPDATPYGINNYSLQVDLKNLNNKEVTLGFAANGVSYASQTVPSNNQIESLRQFFCDGPEIYVYAIRIYERFLSDIEIMQNNFADIATVNRLDISVFKTLDDAKKAEVYKAFSGKTSDTDKAELQKLLDDKQQSLAALL